LCKNKLLLATYYCTNTGNTERTNLFFFSASSHSASIPLNPSEIDDTEPVLRCKSSCDDWEESFSFIFGSVFKSLYRAWVRLILHTIDLESSTWRGSNEFQELYSSQSISGEFNQSRLVVVCLETALVEVIGVNSG
jgi:hypothetical protein